MVSKLKTKDFLKELAEMAAAFRTRIESEVDGFDPDPQASRARVAQAQGDFEYFARTYLPHYIRSESKSEAQQYLYERLRQVADSEESCTDAIAAPRGEAKSTLASLAFPLWCIVTRRKHFMLVVMDSFDQAFTQLESIKAELEFNPRLKMDFPRQSGQGRVWQAGVIVTAQDVKVMAAGSGKKLRGLRHGPYRPDLTILDDIENDENVASPAQRDKLHRWVTKAVLPLGDPYGKYDVIYPGTILHYDSVLARVLNNPLWRSARFRALKRWPDRMDLWDKWEAMIAADGEDAAQAFYLAHKAEMDQGAEVSWPARGLYRLMKIRARDGHDTFASEYLNDPVASEGAPFHNIIQFWVQHDPEWLFFGAVDPSLGKQGSGRDPSAILVGGFSRRHRILDVVEADIRRRVPDRIIEDVLTLQQQYKCVLWVIETIQFQAFLRQVMLDRARERGINLPTRGVIPNTDKALRIESLQPYVKQGQIRLHPSQATLISQLEHFPKADHDDGPDALQMLWTAASTGFASASGFHSIPRHSYSDRFDGDDFDDYPASRHGIW